MLFKKSNKLDRFIKKARKFDDFELKKYEQIVPILTNNKNNVYNKELGLKLVVISDSHGYLAFENRIEEFMSNIKEYDLCIILGDIKYYEIEKILKIIPKEKIIAVRGNHDNLDIYERYGINDINGKIYSYKGINFVGIEGSFKYKKETFPSYTQYESLILAQEIDKNADILITHDCAFKNAEYDMAHTGLIGITYYVYNSNIKWHIHGHIHKSYNGVYDNNVNEKSVYLCEYIEI